MLKLRWLSALLAIVGLWLVVAVGSSMAGPAEVRQIQQELTNLGYDPGPVDGAWGGKTERAARQFLSDKKIDPTTVFTAQGRDEAALLESFRTDRPSADQSGPRVGVSPQMGHSDDIRAVSFSPDGKWIASGGNDQTIKLWSAATGQVQRTFHGHRDWIHAISFSADGQRIVSASSDKTLAIWDAETGRMIHRVTADKIKLDSVAFSPDGRFVVSGGADQKVKLWNADTGRLIRTLSGHKGSISSVAFGPDGDKVFSGSWDGTVKVWRASNGRLVRTLPAKSEGINAIAVSPDGAFLISANFDSTVKLWDLSSARVLRSFTGHKTVISSVDFSPDGQTIVSGGWDDKVIVWDAATARPIHTLSDRQRPIYDSDGDVFAVGFSPDGRRIVSGRGDNTVKIWDAETGKPIRMLKAQSRQVASVTFLPDGNRFVSGGQDGGINLWDLGSGALATTLSSHKGIVNELVPYTGATGVKLFSGSNEVFNGFKIWDLNSGNVERTFETDDYTRALAILPSRGWVVTGHSSLSLWDTATGEKVRSYKSASSSYEGAVFSPDGLRLISGGISEDLERGVITTWNASSGKRLREITAHDGAVNDIAMSPDTKTFVSGGRDESIKVWDTRTGRLLRTLKSHVWATNSLSFSKDGRLLASGGDDNRVILWDYTSGRRLRVFDGHGGEVKSVRLSPDGSRILSGSEDGTIKLWSTKTGKALVTYFPQGDGEWLSLTPEGFFAGTRKAAEALIVVRGFETYNIDQFYQALYRPDLVREKLAGDPKGKVREAAAKLNLDTIIDSGGAPRVAIVSPADGNSVTDDKLTVEARITGIGGGIGRVEWRVNGLTLGVHTKRGFERLADDNAKAVTISQDLWLEPGKNTIEVVAYNAKNLIASEPAKITVAWDGQSSKTPPRLHVLAIGVNDYWDSRLRLKHAVPDAKAMSEALRKAGGELYETVSVTNLVDDEVTADKLEAAFEKLGGEVRPRDVFLFFLAGHGKTVDGKYYFIPQDFRYTDETSITSKGIGQDRWQRWFSRIPARKSLLLYDTCESGSLTGDRLLTRSMERIAALEKLTRAMGRTVLSAATDEAPALEGYKGHGVFTYALLDALNRSDANKNDLIEVTELAGHVDAQVPDISHKAFGFRQVPQMKIVGSNFPLVKRTAALTHTETASPAIPTKPSHFVAKPAEIFVEPDNSGTTLEKLKPGTAVTLIKTEQGWSLIARDGKLLGYVSTSNLLEIQ